MDRLPWIANFDDERGDAPGEDDGREEEGGVAEVGGVEKAAVEEEHRGLGEGDDGKVEDAVDVHVLRFR